MSIAAVAWALKAVHLNGDPIAKLILLGLADHAADDGTAAWPSQVKLAEYADVTVRTVRTKLHVLEELGLIRPGDERVTDHIRADRRPQVWDLDMRAEGISGRKLASSREEPTGGSSVPVVDEPRAETGRTDGRKLLSHKPSLEPSLTKDSLRSSLDARGRATKTQGTRLDPEWMPTPELIAQMRSECPAIDLKAEHLKFVDYWCSKSGKDATKVDWPRTWRNWIRNAKPANGNGHRYALKRQEETDQHFENMLDRARRLDEQDRLREIEQ